MKTVISLSLFIPQPTIPYLEKFVRGSSLRQPDSLCKAVRFWVSLNSLQGNTLDLSFPIKHSEWFQAAIIQQALFSDGLAVGTLQQPIDRIPLSYWLFDMGQIPPETWIAAYAQTFQVSRSIVGEQLKLKPFASKAQTEHGYKRYLLNDFKGLVDLGCLETQVINSKVILFDRPDQLPSEFDLGASTQETMAIPLSLSPVIVQSPDLAEIIHTYTIPINGVRRFYMDLDYVVSMTEGDRVSTNQQFLYEKIWTADPVPPIKIQYHSRSQGQILPLITYPVAIYYSKRAPYLCAYGQTPHQQASLVNWYNFRLDRITQITPLCWSQRSNANEDELPFKLEQAYLDGTLPTPFHIEEKLEEAWGFDICLPAHPLLLRFNRNFHDAYIQASDRHFTFAELTTPHSIQSYIQGLPISPLEKQKLQAHVEIHGHDAFYQAVYRQTDNNIVMRLRAWGPNVEVLYPAQLRQRIQDDLQQTQAMYSTEL